MQGGQPDAKRLDLQIQVEGSSAALVLAARRYFRFLDVEQLELRVPGLSFPLQITGGIQQLKRHETHVRRARLVVAQDGLDELVAARAPLLERAGFSGVDVRARDGHVVARAEVRGDDGAAAFACRFTLQAVADGLRVGIGNSNVFGFVGRAGSRVLYDFCSALLGRAHDAAVGAEQLALATRLSMGSVELHPLRRFLDAVFPPAQWSVPGDGEVELADSGCRPGQVHLEYAARPAPASTGTAVLAERVHIYARHREASAALLRGDLDAAETIYERFGREDEDYAPLVARRLLELLIARRATHERAARLASAHLTRWPTFLPAHLALAVTAAARGDAPAAGDHFARAAYIAEHAGNEEVATGAGAAAGRYGETNGRSSTTVGSPM